MTDEGAAYAALRALMAEAPGTPRPEPAWKHNRFVWVWDNDDKENKPGWVTIHDGGKVYQCAPRQFSDGKWLREKVLTALRKRQWQEYRITTGYQFHDPGNTEWPEFTEWMIDKQTMGPTGAFKQVMVPEFFSVGDKA